MKSILTVLSLLIATIAIVYAQPSVTPYPQGFTSGSGTINQVQPSLFKVSCNVESTVFGVSLQRYSKLFWPFGTNTTGNTAVTLTITIKSDDESLFLGVDESYSIQVPTNGKVTLSANTIYGAMRGLESFSQLITYDQSENTYTIPYVPISIYDSPRFTWRGFMIDSARHFYPINFILHIIDSLGYNKFNTLHWHLVDAVSFPVESSTYPLLTKAAWNPDATFSHEDIEYVVAYAKTYGIRVIPEFDVPGHAAGWGVGYPDLLASCESYAYNVNNLAMQPALSSTYEFLENFFAEISPLFPDQYFHTGGDELLYGCWQLDPNVQQFMKDQGYTSMVSVEQYFEDQLDTILGKLNRTKIVWNDPFENGVQLGPNTLVQVWDSTTIVQDIVNAGLKAIVSYDWYLDKQIPTGNTHYEWQDTWQDFYNADPLDGVTQNANNVIGGEAAMWSEQISQMNFDVRVWPRSIGIAERLWSPISTNNISEAIPRFDDFSCRIAARGVASGPLQPDFCLYPDEFTTYSQKPNTPLSRDVIKMILSKK